MNNDSTSPPQLISVIVPVHNGVRFLGDALASIFAQDFRPIEVIVVDDGSTDGCCAIAQSYPQVQYVYQQTQGSAVARNRGLAICKGEFIAFLDSDDLWLPNKLSIQAAYLAMHPEVGCVSGKMKNCLDPGVTCPPWIDPCTLLQSFNAIQLGTILARRSLFGAVGEFNPVYSQGQDLEWFIRVKESGIPVRSHAETVLLRRIHESNISHNQSKLAEGRLRMLKESIDRRRSAGTPTFLGVL
jgi:glycosyltransferase involved in cell wall biosynthesis